MLVSYEVTNYGVFREPTRLALATPEQTDAPYQRAPSGDRVPFVAMVFGPNGSGKTTLLDSLVRLREAVVNSYRFWQPGGRTNALPFLLDADPEPPPTTWHVEFVPSPSATNCIATPC
ncbi:MAG: AAA family ATPase [Candidatus Nanopelagicales bacterium]